MEIAARNLFWRYCIIFSYNSIMWYQNFLIFIFLHLCISDWNILCYRICYIRKIKISHYLNITFAETDNSFARILSPHRFVYLIRSVFFDMCWRFWWDIGNIMGDLLGYETNDAWITRTISRLNGPLSAVDTWIFDGYTWNVL